MKYVLSDLQGSTRAVMNNNGSSSTVIARHDYVPFGEEIGSGIGLRSGSQGYGAGDTNRWKYGLLERDGTSGPDHTWWRKYESMAGRWTSPDPLPGSIGDPQSFNQYAYTQNDPANFVDPSGLATCLPFIGCIGIGPPTYVVTIPAPANSGPIIGNSFLGDVPFVIVTGGEINEPGGGGPQSASGQNRIRPDCFYPQPAPEADLNANIRTAEERRKFMEQSLFLTGDATRIAMNHYLWFRDQVKKGGPWDYNNSKLRTPEEIASSIYDSFGNFHYGAVGAAAGFPLGELLRAAGYAQETSGDVRGAGQSGGLVGVFTGIGAKAPYGDKPQDQEPIRMGYAYYQKGCHKQ